MKTVLILSLAFLALTSSAPTDKKVVDFEPTPEQWAAFEKRREEFIANPGKYNADEIGPYFEGDIRQIPSAYSDRNGLDSLYSNYYWTNNEVVYEIVGAFSSAELIIIQESMDEIAENTCITFKERQAGDTNYIRLLHDNNDGCWSYVGMIGGQQDMNLPLWCIDQEYSVRHEFLHALGFYHMQSDTTRDNYVTINYQNIVMGYESNFNKYWYANSQRPYDYESVMHYGQYAFSVAYGVLTTIDTTGDPNMQNVIGQRSYVTATDWDKVNDMYCPSK